MHTNVLSRRVSDMPTVMMAVRLNMPNLARVARVSEGSLMTIEASPLPQDATPIVPGSRRTSFSDMTNHAGRGWPCFLRRSRGPPKGRQSDVTAKNRGLAKPK